MQTKTKTKKASKQSSLLALKGREKITITIHKEITTDVSSQLRDDIFRLLEKYIGVSQRDAYIHHHRKAPDIMVADLIVELVLSIVDKSSLKRLDKILKSLTMDRDQS